MNTTESDLDVHGKAFAVVATNAVILLYFLAGPAGLEAIAEGESALERGFYSSVGLTAWTTILFLSLSTASLIAAALSLGALAIPLGRPAAYLQAGGGLLGLAILGLVLHVLASTVQFGSMNGTAWLGLAIIGGLAAMFLGLAVWKANRTM